MDKIGVVPLDSLLEPCNVPKSTDRNKARKDFKAHANTIRQ